MIFPSARQDIPHALIGRAGSDTTVGVLEGRNRDIGLRFVGTSMISDSLALIGVTLCGAEYELLSGKVLRDVLALPEHSRRHPASAGICTINGKKTSVTLAILDNPTPPAEGKHISYAPDTTTLAAIAAWRIDEERERLVKMSTAGMRCPLGGIWSVDGGR